MSEQDERLAATAETIRVQQAKIAQLESADPPTGPLTYRAGYHDGYSDGYADGRAKRWDSEDPNA